jgi:hypothetical protein
MVHLHQLGDVAETNDIGVFGDHAYNLNISAEIVLEHCLG